MQEKMIWTTKNIRRDSRACSQQILQSPKKSLRRTTMSLRANLEELMQRITSALQTAAHDMLQRIWEKLENRIDVCHVSGGAHIEHLLNPL